MVATPLNTAVRFTSLNNVTAYWVETIADPSGPTRGELNAGVDLTPQIPKDGITGFTTTGNTVTADDLRSGFDALLDDGFAADQSSINIYMSKTGTDIRSILARGDYGYVVLFDNNDVAGNFMDVWPAEVISASKSRQGTGMVTVTFSLYSPPFENLVVPA